MSLIKTLAGADHARMRVQKPLARQEGLVTEEVDGELLVYDRENHRGHCLTPAAAKVWKACNGTTGIPAIASDLAISREEVATAVDELDSAGLLEGLSLTSSDGNGVTRRQAIKLGGVVAASPMIYTAVIQPASAAATPPPAVCNRYTTQDCGTGAGCAAVAGCCCCSDGCAGQGSCKTCSSTNFCNGGNQHCQLKNGGLDPDPANNPAKCSSGSSSGTTPASPQGCCGVSGAKSCGCAYAPNQSPGTGGPNGGAGCCSLSNPVPGSNPPQYQACTPGDSNCFPCCNGYPLPTNATFGCCTPSPTTNTCA